MTNAKPMKIALEVVVKFSYCCYGVFVSPAVDEVVRRVFPERLGMGPAARPLRPETKEDVDRERQSKIARDS